MKKLFIIICALFIGIVYADNVITSKEYVDTAGATLQPQVQAKNTNTVLTYPAAGTDTPGEKAIYDASTAYGEQTDALVTAGAFNTALQTALDTEFVCIEWASDWQCLLYQVQPVRNLPVGYTQLEYLESRGAQYIDTGIPPTSDVGVSVKYALTQISTYNHVFGTFLPYFYFGIGSGGTYVQASFGETSNNVVLRMPVEDVQLNMPYTLNINLYNSKKVAFIGIRQATIDKPAFGSNGLTMLMFSSVSTNRVAAHFLIGKIYSMKITDGNSLVRDFIPARRDSDGEIGMYDTVSNTFFTNSGTGEFIAGPAVNIYLPQGN